MPFLLFLSVAWVVAGTLAYALWVKPQQKAELERQVSHADPESNALSNLLPCTSTWLQLRIGKRLSS